MQMNAGMRQEVNSNYKFRNPMLNRKEQVSDKTKGFPAHWSKDVFIIEQRRAVIKNPGVFKYFCTSMTTGMKVDGSRFRHELLELKGVFPACRSRNRPANCTGLKGPATALCITRKTNGILGTTPTDGLGNWAT